MSTTTKIKTALVYVRISQDRAGAGLGVQRQREDCERLAAQLGVAIGGVYCDNDKSAYTGKPRPDWERLLVDIAAGRGDMVLCWHTDRLYRRISDLLRYLAVTNERGIPTHGVTSGMLDLTTAAGRMNAVNYANMSEYEVAHRAERIVSKHQQSAKRGTWRGGTRPFGWGRAGEKSDMNALNPDEAEMIRKAYTDVIAGRALGAIIREWNEAGVTTTTGKEWCYSTLRQLLLRERNYGASVYRGEVVATGQWEPITDEATWRTVSGILKDPGRRLSATNVGKHLLAGLALCGVCNDGSTMVSGTSQIRGGRYHIYRCRTGKHLARRAEFSDRVVEKLVFKIVGRPDNSDLLVSSTAPDKENLSIQARALRARRKELKQLWKAGVMDVAEVTQVDAELRAELESIETRMQSPDRRRALGPLLAADSPETAAKIWHGLDWSQRRSAVDTLMTVTIVPVPKSAQRRFDPKYIVLTPRPFAAKALTAG